MTSITAKTKTISIRRLSLSRSLADQVSTTISSPGGVSVRGIAVSSGVSIGSISKTVSYWIKLAVIICVVMKFKIIKLATIFLMGLKIKFLCFNTSNETSVQVGSISLRGSLSLSLSNEVAIAEAMSVSVATAITETVTAITGIAKTVSTIAE